MSWLQLTLDTHPTETSQLEDLLMEVGAVAIVMQDNADQPVFEPERGTTPLWENTLITGLFDADTNMQSTLQVLENLYQKPLPKHRVEILEDKDWEREWMDNFKPMQFGQRLWVCPSWCDIPDPSAVNLLLDPGLAFGTGTHPTTALCLEWLEQQELNNKTLIDYGCGSGILGIAGLLLGASNMIGVDNDPQALLATNNNAERNSVSTDKLHVYLPENTPTTQADAFIANILAGPLIELAPNFAELCKTGAPIALSGILEQQADDIVKAYEPWFALDKVTQKDEWVVISGHKK